MKSNRIPLFLARGSLSERPSSSSALSLAARGGVVVLLLGALSGTLTSCVVWKEDYDVLAAKQRNEAAAHAIARDDLAKSREEVLALQAKIGRLEQELSDNKRRLDASTESLAQAEFQFGVLEQQKQEAAELVEQLRSEQERLATHLKAFANDRETLNVERERLSAELQRAEVRVAALSAAQERAQQRLVLVRDLSQRLQTEVDREQVSLLFDGDVVVLRLDASKMFKGKSVSSSGKQLLSTVGQVLAGDPKVAGDLPAHSGAVNSKAQTSADGASAAGAPPRLVLSDWEKGAKLNTSQERLQLVKQSLIAAGVSGVRFADETTLQAYQAGVAEALQPLPKSEVPETSLAADADPQPADQPPAASRPVAEPKPLSVPGQAVVIHLVPAD